MKKNLFLVAAVALMALVSCNKEEIGNNKNGVVFVAELEQEAETKTALGGKGENGRKALWVKGDKISINGTEFTADKDGAVVEFSATSEFKEEQTYRAVYPASSYKSGAVMIPATQDGTFANASIAVAESNTNTLVFNNLSSILKFQVPAACTTVTFESNNSIAGNVSVTYENGEMTPNYGSLTQLSKKITVTADGGFKVGTDYYVAVKPDNHTLTVSIDGKLSKASDKTAKVERTKIHNLGVLPEPAKLSRNLKFSATNVVGYTSGWVERPTLSGETSGVIYQSSEPTVAAVNAQTGELTITEKKGTTRITASAPETETHLAGTVYYTLTVNQSNIRIYVRIYPRIYGWGNWLADPKIYYWGSYGSIWPGKNLNYQDRDDDYDYYYEFEFSNSKKINFLIHCDKGEQSHDSATITLNKNYYYSVWTEWKDGKLVLNQDGTDNA